MIPTTAAAMRVARGIGTALNAKLDREFKLYVLRWEVVHHFGLRMGWGLTAISGHKLEKHEPL
jgi:hypothetical protein